MRRSTDRECRRSGMMPEQHTQTAFEVFFFCRLTSAIRGSHTNEKEVHIVVWKLRRRPKPNRHVLKQQRVSTHGERAPTHTVCGLTDIRREVLDTKRRSLDQSIRMCLLAQGVFV